MQRPASVAELDIRSGRQVYGDQQQVNQFDEYERHEDAPNALDDAIEPKATGPRDRTPGRWCKRCRKP
jgi:hypothetical protein